MSENRDGGTSAAHKQPQPVLALQSVTKSFGSKQAVQEVSFAVNKGEIFGFMGPNGAGKSTTIRMILDVLQPAATTRAT